METKTALDGLIELLEELAASFDRVDEPTEESSILHSQLKMALDNGQLDEFLQELENLGKDAQDVFNSVIIDNANALLEDLYDAWANRNKPIKEFLEYVYEVLPPVLDEICQYIISGIGRPMTDVEIGLAQTIYGSSLDYDKIYFSEKDLSNAVIFGIQDYFTENPDSRAFVTFNLVNHDVSDGPLSNRTFIHELCHVWQYQHEGPIYLIEALHAHATLTNAYNYGYDDTMDDGYYYGEGGGKEALEAAINNNPSLTPAEVFELFNPEQQAKIIEHYYMRLNEASSPKDVTAWQPFKDVVYKP